jgi:hypothetical protein
VFVIEFPTTVPELGAVFNISLFGYVFVIEFPTTVPELGAVFNMFDGNKTGSIQYKSFADTIMRPDKQVSIYRLHHQHVYSVTCSIQYKYMPCFFSGRLVGAYRRPERPSTGVRRLGFPKIEILSLG